MEVSGEGKSPNTTISFRYNANNEELEELFDACEDDPPTPQFDNSPTARSESASPKKADKTSSIIDKYFKSIRAEKAEKEKVEETKPDQGNKSNDENRSPPKEVTSSPMKEYLSRLGKRNTAEVTPDVKEGSNETWKIFHDFKFKIAQAVEDMKTRSVDDAKEKSVPRDNSISDSEENSAIKDSDQSVGDTDNQVSSLASSLQNLSELTQPVTAKPTDLESSLPLENKSNSESSDDTHRNLVHSDSFELPKEILNDANVMEVESGIEALEDGIDGFSEMYPESKGTPEHKCQEPSDSLPTSKPSSNQNFGLPPSKTNIPKTQDSKTAAPVNYFFNFPMYFLTVLLCLNYSLFPDSHGWNGFFLGIWCFWVATSLKNWVLDNYFSHLEPYKNSMFQLRRSSALPVTYTIPSVKEHRPIKKFEGWINHFRYPEYDAFSYHINKTTTAFMKIEGCNLRLSYTTAKIAKRALWDEKLEKVSFYQHRLYNLTGARVILLPKGLVRRRQWSKKYPICIILSDKEKIQVLEKENAAAEKKSEFNKKDQSAQEMESTETNTSPEKKRKFVWRRREKSLSHSEGEANKEGLRHRLVRKMHRDKKTDNSTATEPSDRESQADKNVQFEENTFHDAEMELATNSVTSTKDDDEDIDETDINKIKEFLEEAELETGVEGADGEWSLHVKHSKEHINLFLFARTGRDKHEWYRRLSTAISEANSASADSSAADEKTSSETVQDGKESIEMAVYKVTDKDTVAFGKSTSNIPAPKSDSISENVTKMTSPITLSSDIADNEKVFWPYLIKILQSKNDVPEECRCRMLPAEVTWLNASLARLVYDVMRAPKLNSILQAKIQRKLHTLKLPSFMSPLVVTELCLVGACPLVERVSTPAWDERGVWFDADLRYDGGAYITILTQINLMKLKEKNMTLEEQLLATKAENTVERDLEVDATLDGESLLRKNKPAIFDSDVEDSAESSSDDESPPLQPVDSTETVTLADQASITSAEVPVSSKKKFLRMVDKIATNKYFQQVTDYKYVKRAMEGLSNTDIKLQLEVHGLEGRLALNLPPPPHDRVWFGFRTNPQLVLKAQPAVGARTLRFAHISNWIEQKLSKEFEKVLVLPNMEDIILDFMSPTPVTFE